jgi:hypothetical protein
MHAGSEGLLALTHARVVLQAETGEVRQCVGAEGCGDARAVVRRPSRAFLCGHAQIMRPITSLMVYFPTENEEPPYGFEPVESSVGGAHCASAMSR